MHLEDPKIFNDFLKRELESPSPRKFVNGQPIYASPGINPIGGVGEPFLSDFGSALRGDVEHDEDCQPNVYRSPEVILKKSIYGISDVWYVTP